MSKLEFKQENSHLWRAESPNGLFAFGVFKLLGGGYKTVISHQERWGERQHYVHRVDVVSSESETLEEAQSAALGMLADWLTSAVDEMVLMEDG